MTDIDIVAHQLKEAGLNFTEIETRAPREVRIHVGREGIHALADYVRDRFRARPELIVAEDMRAHCGGFTVRYLFELEGLDVFLVASVAVPAGDRRFPSLATRWYWPAVSSAKSTISSGSPRWAIPTCGDCRFINSGPRAIIPC